MAVALKFNGINNYVQTPSGGSAVTALMPTDEWMIEFKIKRTNDRATQYILANSYGGIRAYLRDTRGSLTVNTNNIIHTSLEVPNDSEFHVVRVVLSNSSDTVKCYLDDMVTPVDILSGKDANFAVHGGGTGSLHRITLGRYQHTSGGWFEGEIEYAHLKDLAGDAEFYFSAEASDREITGAQPVLVDTVGNNNATGVNFPTDGSAWVDLGGGVSVNVSDSLSESASSANNDSIVYVGEFSVLGTSSNSSGLANQDSISFASSVNISDAVNNSLTVANDDNIYLVGELVVNDLIVDSSSTASDDSIALAATIIVNDSLIDSISLVVNDSIRLSGAFNVIDQLINSASIANNDSVSFSSNVSFVGSVVISEQLTNSLSLASIDSISFAGEVIITGSAVNSSSSSGNDFIQTGAFEFTVYKETNISSVPKSRNINSPSLSTNIDG